MGRTNGQPCRPMLILECKQESGKHHNGPMMVQPSVLAGRWRDGPREKPGGLRRFHRQLGLVAWCGSFVSTHPTD